MTSFKDNIYSGNIATTSANSSLSSVTMGKTFNFSGAGNTTAVTKTGTFPPNVENVTAYLFITANASATVSNKITVSAGGTNLVVIDQFGSAMGQSGGSTTSLVRFTYQSSATANPPVPSPSNNGGEIPYSVTFVPVSADKVGTYQLRIHYNRADTTWGPQGPYSANTFV